MQQTNVHAWPAATAATTLFLCWLYAAVAALVCSVLTTVAEAADPRGCVCPHALQWYAWPEGYLGQSFSLLGKLEPRATALRDDIDKLSDFCKARREESQFSEHTITSAEDASAMVSAVVGAEVDMGLFKAGGSASFEMYQVRHASMSRLRLQQS